MAWWSRLRGWTHRSNAPRAATGRLRATRTDNRSEAALRSVLAADPNDEAAFRTLAELVRRRAAASPTFADPLAAPVDEQEREHAANLAHWALAEELAGNPRGWYPLIELGRLSLGDDPGAALRRLATAAERDPSGRALAQALEVLREAGLPGEALGLGVGHWRAREHDLDAGRQLVLAAIEADRPFEARHHIESLAMNPDAVEAASLQAELRRAVERAERAGR